MKTLQYVNSPYTVQISDKIEKLIYVAIENSCPLKSLLSNLILIKRIPLYLLEYVCDFNSQFLDVPITYQHLWISLHNTSLIRVQSSGKIFCTNVQFSSCYVNRTSKLDRLIKKAISKLNISKRQFSILCGFGPKAMQSKNSPIPLFTIIKTCQILNLNYSEVLKGSILRAKNNPNNSFVIPLKFKPEILRILTWIKTDGHIKLGSTHIEISQMENKQALVELNEIIKQTFRIKHKETWFVKSRGEDSLIYSSAALRQFLVLFYHIPPGYKTGSTSKLNFIQLSRKDQLKILSAYVETEGCLSYNTTRGKKRKLPKFEISTKTENLTEECFQLLVNLGYTPKKYYKHNLFKAGLYNSKQVIHLINELKPHLLSSKKTDYLKQICSNGIGL